MNRPGRFTAFCKATASAGVQRTAGRLLAPRAFLGFGPVKSKMRGSFVICCGQSLVGWNASAFVPDRIQGEHPHREIKANPDERKANRGAVGNTSTKHRHLWRESQNFNKNERQARPACISRPAPIRFASLNC
jgi:hypothetical protein